jgi:hypothetical protein
MMRDRELQADTTDNTVEFSLLRVRIHMKNKVFSNRLTCITSHILGFGDSLGKAFSESIYPIRYLFNLSLIPPRKILSNVSEAITLCQ